MKTAIYLFLLFFSFQSLAQNSKQIVTIETQANIGYNQSQKDVCSDLLYKAEMLAIHKLGVTIQNERTSCKVQVGSLSYQDYFNFSRIYYMGLIKLETQPKYYTTIDNNNNPILNIKVTFSVDTAKAHNEINSLLQTNEDYIQKIDTKLKRYHDELERDIEIYQKIKASSIKLRSRLLYKELDLLSLDKRDDRVSKEIFEEKETLLNDLKTINKLINADLIYPIPQIDKIEHLEYVNLDNYNKSLKDYKLTSKVKIDIKFDKSLKEEFDALIDDIDKNFNKKTEFDQELAFSTPFKKTLKTLSDYNSNYYIKYSDINHWDIESVYDNTRIYLKILDKNKNIIKKTYIGTNWGRYNKMSSEIVLTKEDKQQAKYYTLESHHIKWFTTIFGAKVSFQKEFLTGDNLYFNITPFLNINIIPDASSDFNLRARIGSNYYFNFSNNKLSFKPVIALEIGEVLDNGYYIIGIDYSNHILNKQAFYKNEEANLYVVIRGISLGLGYLNCGIKNERINSITLKLGYSFQ